MEQAVNLFSKGLQIDTNPMVQGDDTLSDALNATFVTMNGNEVILLNDMGNRRVDHAFLPAGYEPVGMKEYGGIIYVASYNPITNRSLIGSFPSPERRISEIDDDSLGIGSYYSFGERFFGTNNIDSTSANGINFLKNDSFMDSLTSDTSLHAGDKFSIYSDYIWKHESDISNFNQYDADTKKVDPKNKLFTLAVGVMNSLNEFVDITSSLERFKKGEDDKAEMITDYDSDSEKFNKGYFIAPTGPETNQEEDILPKEREKLAVNTYAYKLVGPLQLKTTLNHILNFDFTLAWETTSNPNIYKLIVTGIAVYNCPDKLDSNENSGRIDTNGESVTVTTTRALYAKSLLNDINYKIYEDYSENGLDSFDLFLKNGSNWEISLVKAGYPKLQTTYDINTNTFTSTCTKIYNILVSPSTQLTEERFEDGSRPEVSLENTIIDYYICVKALAESYKEMEGEEEKEYKDIYLKNLSYQGSVDVNKIGSNIVELNGYRYYYDKTSDGTYITMTFQIDAFPSSFTKFTNFKVAYGELKLVGLQWEWDYDNNTLYQSDTVPSGRVTFTFKEEQGDENGIKPKNLYKVEFSYMKESTIEDNSRVLPTKIHRFLLTTPLFNPCYSGSNDDYTEDYGLFMGDIETQLETGRVDIAYNNNEIILEDISESEQKRREDYLNVKLELMGKIDDSLNSSSVNTSGSLLSTSSNPSPMSYNIEYTENFNLLYNYKVLIQTNSNYPNLNLSTNELNKIDLEAIKNSITTSDVADSVILTEGNIGDNLIVKPNPLLPTAKYLIGNISSATVVNNRLTFNILHNDWFLSKTSSRNPEFGTIYVDLIDPIMKEYLFPGGHFGFLVVSHGAATHNWWTYLNVKSAVVQTVADHCYTLDSSSWNESYTDYGKLGFKNGEKDEYKMGDSLNKMKSSAEDAGVSFLYMFVPGSTPESDTSATWNQYPANGEYYIYNNNRNTKYYLYNYCIVFWRNYQGDLYLLTELPIQYRDNIGPKDVNTAPYRDDSTWNIKEDILKIVNGENTVSYVVPVVGQTFSNIKLPDSDNYKYNDLYSFTITVPLVNAYYTGNLNNWSGKKKDLLGFNIKQDIPIPSSNANGCLLTIPSYISIKNSTADFQFSISEILTNNYITDIYKETGEKVPLTGANNIYVNKNGKLKLVKSPPFEYSAENKTLLFRKAKLPLTRSKILLECIGTNLRGGGAGGTGLPFKDFYVVTQNMLKYNDGD